MKVYSFEPEENCGRRCFFTSRRRAQKVRNGMIRDGDQPGRIEEHPYACELLEELWDEALVRGPGEWG